MSRLEVDAHGHILNGNKWINIRWKVRFSSKSKHSSCLPHIFISARKKKLTLRSPEDLIESRQKEYVGRKNGQRKAKNMSACTLSLKKKTKMKTRVCFKKKLFLQPEWTRWGSYLPTWQEGVKRLLSAGSYLSRDKIIELSQSSPDYSLQIYQSETITSPLLGCSQ